MSDTEELELTLKEIRIARQPNKRGIMLLTQFLAGLMFQYGSLTQDKIDSFEFLFWLTHNGDGTLITTQHDNRRP